MRLIDADEVDKQAMYGHILFDDGTENLGYTRIVLGTVIKDAPTIEAEPVKHGHWEQKYTGSRKVFFCSVCSEWQGYGETDYCPSCGAKMDEEVQE